MSLYDSWTRAQLIRRLEELDGPRPRVPRDNDADGFDWLSRPRRKIALKFLYHGWEYNGLSRQPEATPLPTVEAVLEQALIDTRLIDPATGFDGCGFSRCGRTDKGVSSAGQVVALWVRSAVAPAPAKADTGLAAGDEPMNLTLTFEPDLNGEARETIDRQSYDEPGAPSPTFEALHSDGTEALDSESHLLPTEAELPYPRLLNRVLPPSIRVTAWSPVRDSFDARFSCVQRHYKYFFRLTDRLSLDLMRDGASRLVGTHDFRNFCKVDGSKGIESFVRTITDVRINCVADDVTGHISGPGLDPSLYVINVIGPGFLWHQIRHIAAVLFHVGQQLEPPHIVNSLLNCNPTHPHPPFRDEEPTPAILEGKPKYEMADGLPLVLWDCGFREGDLNWQPNESGFFDAFMMQLDSSYTNSLVQSTLLSYLKRAAALTTRPIPRLKAAPPTRVLLEMGAGRTKATTKYISFLKRELSDSPSVINEKWREGAGLRRKERKSARQSEAAEIEAVEIE